MAIVMVSIFVDFLAYWFLGYIFDILIHFSKGLILLISLKNHFGFIVPIGANFSRDVIILDSGLIFDNNCWRIRRVCKHLDFEILFYIEESEISKTNSGAATTVAVYQVFGPYQYWDLIIFAISKYQLCDTLFLLKCYS